MTKRFGRCSGIAGVPDPAFGILCGDGIEGWFELRLQSFESAWGFRLERLFHLGPSGLDPVELGRVTRQVQQSNSGPIEQVPHFRGVMRAQVVHYQDRIRLQLLEPGHQHLLEISQQHGGRGGRRDAHRGHQPVTPECPLHRQPLSRAKGNGAIGALPAWGSGVGARHLGGDAAFIQEHQAFHGKLRSSACDKPRARPQSRAAPARPPEGSFFRTQLEALEGLTDHRQTHRHAAARG